MSLKKAFNNTVLSPFYWLKTEECIIRCIQKMPSEDDIKEVIKKLEAAGTTEYIK